MKPFRFQQFDILQDKNVFRVGTDAVLLGALATVDFAETALEVGCGTGIISLMLAQRNLSLKTLALDISPKAEVLSRQNFQNSTFASRLESQCQDFKTFDPAEKFDLIISNPPYFEVNDSTKDVVARQRLELGFSDLIQKSSTLLSARGRLCVIIPTQSEKEFTELCRHNQLFLAKKILIFANQNTEAKRCILEYTLDIGETIVLNLVIEKSPRVFSDKYLELTKDFHVFS